MTTIARPITIETIERPAHLGNTPPDAHRPRTGPRTAHSTEASTPVLGARVRELIDRYDLLLNRPDDEMRDALGQMIRAEFALPEQDRLEFTYSRLRAWLTLDGEDARIIARAFEEAMARCSTAQQQLRLAAERSAMMNGLRFSEFRALCGIVPWLRSEESLRVLFPEHGGDETAAPALTAEAA